MRKQAGTILHCGAMIRRPAGLYRLTPYDQFPSPYTGMGNNPVSNIDPSGGYIYDMSGGQFWGMSIGMVAGSVAGYYISKSNGGNGMDGALMGAVGGGAAGYGLGSMNWSGIGNALGNAGKWIGNGFQNDWKGFYKSDLITYSTSKGIIPTEKKLGDLFEDIFEEWAGNNFKKKDLEKSRFRRSGPKWTEGDEGNSKPDFVSDDFYDNSFIFSPFYNEIRVEEGSAWEIKQNNGKGIYPSSNNSQIIRHLSNLAAKHSIHVSTGRYYPKLELITTYDVEWSNATLLIATGYRVQYSHSRSKYKIVNGEYKFKFVNHSNSKEW